MAAGDTIRLLTRYHAGTHNDPRENRLTAALAALLDQSPVLASRVAEAWLGGNQAGTPITVRVQRPVGGNVGWIDLEIRVGGPRPTIVWIEAKVGHRLSGENQLAKYVGRLRQLDVGARDRLVLLLAPAQKRKVFAQIPSLDARSGSDIGPYFVSWQDLYGVLTSLGGNLGPAHIQWLRAEVLGYMESEGLKAIELQSRHLTALRHIDEAAAALAAVLERARFTLSARWKLSSAIPTPAKDDWEYDYRPTPRGSAIARRTKTALSWGIEGADVYAGIYFKRSAGGAVLPRTDDEWRLALLVNTEDDEDWDQDDFSDRDLVWLGRTQSLRDLLESRTVESQGDRLAAFVDATFTSIASARPDIPTQDEPACSV